jgi:hypothetical protein
LWIGGALLSALAVGVPALGVPTGNSQLITKAFRRSAPRIVTRGQASAVYNMAAVSSRGRTSVVVLLVDKSSLVDTDNNGEVSTGDMAIASGRLVNTSGSQVGTWEGTFAHTSEDSSLLNLTLRFPRQGTLSINGAPFTDGSPFRDSTGSRFPAAPIVGSTGSVRYRGSAGFGLDQDDNLAVVLPR